MKLNLNKLEDIKQAETLIKKGYKLIAYSNNIATFDNKETALRSSKIVNNQKPNVV